MTEKRTVYDEAWLLVPAVVALFALEVLWAVGSDPMLPYSVLFAPAALAVLVLLSLVILLGLRWTESRWPGSLPLVGSGLVLLILGIKLYAVEGHTLPLTFVYLGLPPVLVALWQWQGREAGRSVLFWGLLASLFLTVSTDALKVIMIFTRGTGFFQVTTGLVLGGLEYLTLELLSRFLSPLARVSIGGRILGGSAAGLLLGAALLGWTTTGVYSRLPTGLEDFSPRFTGSIPSSEITGNRSLEDLPNIILISIDTLRWDMAPPIDTGLNVPALRRLQRDSLTFTDHFSSSVWTLPSHASLFTGQLPWHHGAVILPASIKNDVGLYPQRLRELGYATAGFTDGGFLGRGHGFARGYETYRVPPFGASATYRQFLPGGLQFLAAAGLPTSSGVPVEFRRNPPDPEPQKHHKFKANVEVARRWIEHHRASSDRPFFLFLHTYQVHDYNHLYEQSLNRLKVEHPELADIFDGGSTPHHATIRENWRRIHEQLNKLPLRNLRHVIRSEPDDLQSVLGAANPEDPDLQRFRHWQGYARDILEGLWHLYRYGIEATDETLGEFLGFLDDQDLYRPSLIVLVSDHGEGFLRQSPVLGHHGGQPEDTLMRVPLWIKFPGNRHAGDTVQQFVQISDVFPLLFDYLDIQSPPPPTLGRRPSMPGLLAGNDPGRRFIRGGDQTEPFRPPRFVVRGPRYKMSKSFTETLLRFRRVQQQALPEEPVAPSDVPGDVRRGLTRRVDALIEDYRLSDRPYQASDETLTLQQRQQLKALGYVD